MLSKGYYTTTTPGEVYTASISCTSHSQFGVTLIPFI